MSTKKTHQLLIRVSEKDMEQIQQNARVTDKTVAAFVREVATDFCVLKVDYESIINHTKEISALRNAVNQLVYTIKKTGDYVPADLEYILEKINEISKSENEFLNMMLEDKDAKSKIIRQEVRKIVRNNIKKAGESKC